MCYITLKDLTMYKKLAYFITLICISNNILSAHFKLELNAADKINEAITSHKNIKEIEDVLTKYPDAINKIGTINWSPLCAAAWSGRLDVVELLLRSGAKPNEAIAPYIRQTPPLHCAATAWATASDTRMDKPDPKKLDTIKNIVKLLINAGADAEQQNIMGLTAIDFARQGEYTPGTSTEFIKLIQDE